MSKKNNGLNAFHTFSDFSSCSCRGLRTFYVTIVTLKIKYSKLIDCISVSYLIILTNVDNFANEGENVKPEMSTLFINHINSVTQGQVQGT